MQAQEKTGTDCVCQTDKQSQLAHTTTDHTALAGWNSTPLLQIMTVWTYSLDLLHITMYKISTPCVCRPGMPSRWYGYLLCRLQYSNTSKEHALDISLPKNFYTSTVRGTKESYARRAWTWSAFVSKLQLRQATAYFSVSPTIYPNLPKPRTNAKSKKY